MKENFFYITLALITILTAIGLFVLLQIDPFKSFKGLFISALIFFIILTIALYYISKRAAVHKNGMLFIYVMLFAILIKFGFCLITLFLYNRLYAPSTNLYVLPFLGIYVIYTIFETYFMMKLGKIRPKDVH
jgi:hypothetical protein